MDRETEAQIKAIVKEGIKEVLFDMGLDGSDHRTILEHRKDQTFVREQRIMCEQLRAKGIWYVISLVVLGFAALLGIGVKGWFNAG